MAEPAHPAPGTPVAVDPRNLVGPLRADEVMALEKKRIG